MRRYFQQALAISFGGMDAPATDRGVRVAAGRGLLLTGIALSVCFFSACDSKHTADIGNSKEMIAALTEKVPKGTSVAAAKVFMETELFQVEDVKKGKWKGKSDVTFLKCTRRDGSPPIFRQWEVALINDGKVVTSIEARTALLYP